jgi:DNA-binding GntR family transcriptional regulator
MKKLWQHCHAATMARGVYSIIEDAAILTDGARIEWIGPRAAAPDIGECERIDLEGAWVTPGLIDCHTHLVFGGDRSGEFEQRLNGVSYAEIAAAGGGIASTVRATREASEDDLLASAIKRARPLLADGVTVLEVKSGYGLDLASERKMLRVARRLGEVLPVTVRATCLSAHALPAEYAGRADAYIELICTEILPALAAEGLVDAVDAFCEHLAFSPAQVERVFQAAQRLGLPVKLHADQLTDCGGAALAARFGVSRTPIREALKVLAAEGVLQILPHRGAIVARITEEQIAELFPVMASLERLAGLLACERAGEADIARVRALHDRMMEHFKAGNEAEYLRQNRLVHEAFFEIAGNATLSAFYQQILTRIHACRFVVRKSPEHWAAAVAEHEQMMAALEARDGPRLASLLEEPVTGTTAGIARAFIRRVEAEAPAAEDGKARTRRGHQPLPA